MKHLSLTSLCIAILLISSQCDNETDPPIGHLKLTVTYPEAVVVPDQLTYWIQVPGVGAEARLYDKDARCLGYKDAGFGIAYIGANSITSLYISHANENGEILFEDIEPWDYVMTPL